MKKTRRRLIDIDKKQRQKIGSQVAQALRKGLIIKPKHCSKCPSTFRVFAHHDDYNFPLKVRWLCHWCHIHFHERRNWHRKKLKKGQKVYGQLPIRLQPIIN